MWFETVLHLVSLPFWLKIWYLAFSSLWKMFPDVLSQGNAVFLQQESGRQVFQWISRDPRTHGILMHSCNPKHAPIWPIFLHEVLCHPGRPDTSGWSEAGSTNLVCFFRLAEGLIVDSGSCNDWGKILCWQRLGAGVTQRYQAKKKA